MGKSPGIVGDVMSIKQRSTPRIAGVPSADSSAHAKQVSDLESQREGHRPVWLRAPSRGLEPHVGISRATLYRWSDKGWIRSKSIRQPGAVRGIRLFELASILKFIEGQTAVPATEAAAAGQKGVAL